jgi:hypothetical protein
MRSLLKLASLVAAAACAGSSTPVAAPAPMVSASIPSPDPRIGLKAGWFDAQEATWNLRVVSTTKPSAAFLNATTPGDRRLTNSDLAFTGKFAIQGNYSGYQVWDISNAAKPRLHAAYVCPGSQSDVSVYKNLAFVSGEAVTGRLDCGLQGVPDSVSKDRLRGIRIFDITNVARPKYIANVQTCRGSHTHTVVEDPRDSTNVYIYVSGSSTIRSTNELPGCSAAPLEQDPNTARFRIEVIQVPLADPTKAHIVTSPRIFQGLAAAPRHSEPVDSTRARAAAANRPVVVVDAEVVEGGRPAGGGGGGGGARGGPEQCHDITAYPAIGYAGGACRGYGILLDIRNPANPVRVNAVSDSNFAAWHSVTFNNDGSKVLFSDEWGGGSAPRCRATDKMEWGADAIFTLSNNTMTFKKYWKMPAAQTNQENCVAHNGSLVPIPGRDVMVQGWYQGGVSVFDWTDAMNPFEIAFHDRGPMDSTKLLSAGSWSAYWYNGVIVSSEISRGLDIFELVASPHLTQNEIDAARTVRLDYLNTQGQPQYTWPASFALSRAYLDQLERSRGLPADKIASARASLSTAEKAALGPRRQSLTDLAAQLNGDARSATDQAKVGMLVNSVRNLANAQK